jgi:hypothetical protein
MTAMSIVTDTHPLDKLLDPVAGCFTREVAQRIIDLKLDPAVQARLDQLAAKANAGTLTDDEVREYEEYVEGIDLMGVLKAKARMVLAREQVECGTGFANPPQVVSPLPLGERDISCLRHEIG